MKRLVSRLVGFDAEDRSAWHALAWVCVALAAFWCAMQWLAHIDDREIESMVEHLPPEEQDAWRRELWRGLAEDRRGDHWPPY